MGLFALVLLGTFVASLVIGEGVRRLAVRRALLDSPNARSLHVEPTPRLGGVALVLTTTVASFALLPEMTRSVSSLLGLCIALAFVGLHDDVRPLSSGVRFAFQFALATSGVWLLGIPAVSLARGTVLAVPGWLVAGALVIWIVGVLNIYNFMDGMDGLAGSQTLITAAALAVLVGPGDIASVMALLAVSGLAFLVHNFPPARMFLGDAGSTFIGMLFAGTAVLGMHRGIPLTESALALAPFLLDGTFTILRRAARGERVWQPHRSHLYQRAVGAGRSHREVLLVYLVWMAVSGGAAIAASRGTLALVLGWLLTLGGLVAVRAWVSRLESERAKTA